MHLSLTLGRSAAATARSPRTAWASRALLSGFVATFALAIVLALDYAFVAAVGTAHGDRLARWSWALGPPSVGSMHGDRITLAIALTLLLGLVAALAHARFAEPWRPRADWGAGRSSRSCPGCWRRV